MTLGVARARKRDVIRREEHVAAEDRDVQTRLGHLLGEERALGVCAGVVHGLRRAGLDLRDEGREVHRLGGYLLLHEDGTALLGEHLLELGRETLAVRRGVVHESDFHVAEFLGERACEGALGVVTGDDAVRGLVPLSRDLRVRRDGDERHVRALVHGRSGDGAAGVEMADDGDDTRIAHEGVRGVDRLLGIAGVVLGLDLEGDTGILGRLAVVRFGDRELGRALHALAIERVVAGERRGEADLDDLGLGAGIRSARRRLCGTPTAGQCERSDEREDDDAGCLHDPPLVLFGTLYRKISIYGASALPWWIP